MDTAGYLARLDVDPDRARAGDLDALAALQRAHVTTVPFETLAITGDPHGARDGDGVSLDLGDLYAKIVDRERGGFCFELNGLFGWLLDELGYDPSIRAARVVGEDGAGPPANHRTHVVELGGREYVVDVGMGVPTMRCPTPLDGEPTEDEAGVRWRVVASDRPDADYATQYRTPRDDDWQIRYVFRDVPREPWYFEPTCEYLATAPESPFTGDPVATIATPEGHAKLDPETLTRYAGAEKREEAVPREAWLDALEREFGVDYRW